MNEYEALNQILAAAIAQEQANPCQGVTDAAEKAARAFKAGLAAFDENPEPASAPTGTALECGCRRRSSMMFADCKTGNEYALDIDHGQARPRCKNCSCARWNSF